jgi:hypothetical protein
VQSVTSQSEVRRGAKASRVSCSLLGCVLFLLAALSYGQKSSPEGPKEPLGSLNSVGEVYVNDSSVPTESTIFAGDRIRTGATGVAIFTMGGSGTVKIAPKSEVLISGSHQFSAELQTGTVVLHSVSGGTWMSLRLGDYVVLPSTRAQATTSKVERDPAGSFFVSCLDGNIGVLTLTGGSGDFLQAGQSVRVSPTAEAAVIGVRPIRVKPAFGVEFPDKKGWILLGLGGAGAATLALEIAQHGGKKSVSPAVP